MFDIFPHPFDDIVTGTVALVAITAASFYGWVQIRTKASESLAKTGYSTLNSL